MLNSTQVEFVHNEKYKYMLQVPKSVTSRTALPADCRLIAQTKKVVRFYTPGIERLLPALDEASDDMRVAQQAALLSQLRRIAPHAHAIAAAVASLARVDCLLSLARAAAPWAVSCEPQFVTDTPTTSLHIKEAYHPTLSQALEVECIPNDIDLGNAEHRGRMVLLTGPNMGGTLLNISICFPTDIQVFFFSSLFLLFALFVF